MGTVPPVVSINMKHFIQKVSIVTSYMTSHQTPRSNRRTVRKHVMLI